MEQGRSEKPWNVYRGFEAVGGARRCGAGLLDQPKRTVRDARQSVKTRVADTLNNAAEHESFSVSQCVPPITKIIVNRKNIIFMDIIGDK
jgi:hypothetical protein